MAQTLDSFLKYAELLSIYQNLLSDTQREILGDYFFYNLSFSEIAENRNITRSAVEDAVKKGKKKLDDYEEKLCSLKVLQEIRNLKANTSDEKTKAKLDKIERMMKQ